MPKLFALGDDTTLTNGNEALAFRNDVKGTYAFLLATLHTKTDDPLVYPVTVGCLTTLWIKIPITDRPGRTLIANELCPIVKRHLDPLGFAVTASLCSVVGNDPPIMSVFGGIGPGTTFELVKNLTLDDTFLDVVGIFEKKGIKPCFDGAVLPPDSAVLWVPN